MVHLNATILISAVLVSAALADKDRERTAPETFLVQDNRGLAFLEANGAERERMEKWAGNGAFSPDGSWLACVEFDRETSQCKLLIRSREKLIENESLPLVWGTVGNGYLPVWSADSKRLLIGEN